MKQKDAIRDRHKAFHGKTAENITNSKGNNVCLSRFPTEDNAKTNHGIGSSLLNNLSGQVGNLKSTRGMYDINLGGWLDQFNLLLRTDNHRLNQFPVVATCDNCDAHDSSG